jgi:hypothetical protein
MISSGMMRARFCRLVEADTLTPFAPFPPERACWLLLVGGVEPIRCGRPIYYRRPEMKALVGANRFQTSSGMMRARFCRLVEADTLTPFAPFPPERACWL